MRLLASIHRWAGGLVGLLMALIALSGTILIWEGAWVRLPGAHQPFAPNPVAIGTVIETALSLNDGLARITFANDEIGLHMAGYRDGGGAYLSQDGTVVERWNSVWGRPELWLFALHHYLFLGEVGKYTTGVLGFLVLGFSVSGLILWWRTRRTFEFRLWPKRLTKSGIIRQHRDIGAVASPLLVLSAATGVLMVFPSISDIVTRPWVGEISTDLEPSLNLGPLDPDLDWTASIAQGQAAFPQAALRRLSFPATPGEPLRLRMKQDFEWTPNGRTNVLLDPADGSLIAVDDPAGDGAGAISEKWYPIHAAKVGGIAWRIALTFCGITLMSLSLLASWSFWFGSKKSRRRKVSKAKTA